MYVSNGAWMQDAEPKHEADIVYVPVAIITSQHWIPRCTNVFTGLLKLLLCFLFFLNNAYKTGPQGKKMNV